MCRTLLLKFANGYNKAHCKVHIKAERNFSTEVTNLKVDELSLLIKLKYDKYIEYCKHGEICVLCNKPKVDN